MNGLDLRFSIPKFKVETPVKTIRISLSEETTLVLNKKKAVKTQIKSFRIQLENGAKKSTLPLNTLIYMTESYKVKLFGVDSSSNDLLQVTISLSLDRLV